MVATKKSTKVRVQKGDFKRRLCDWLVRGQTIRAFCRRPGNPTVQTVYIWMRQDLAFAEEVREAKFIGYDMMAQECLDLADDCELAEVPKVKVQIDTRLKLLARWDTGRYGDKILVGGDGAHPIKVMNNGEVMSEILGLLAIAKARQLKDTGGLLPGDRN